MPLVGLKCGKCLQDVDVDHFAPDRCLYCPEALAKAVLQSSANRPLGWSVTMIQGSIREHILKQERNYRVDPVKHMSMELGTAMHGVLGRYDYPDNQGRAQRYYGSILGLAVSGEPDLVSFHENIIADYKFTGGLFRIKTSDLKHRIQVSLYAELARQQDGLEVKHGVLYYGGFGQKMLTFKFDIIPLEECLDWKVDRVRTLRDNIELIKKYELGNMGMADIPCGCQDTYFGPVCKADRYCDVSSECRALDEIPF